MAHVKTIKGWAVVLLFFVFGAIHETEAAAAILSDGTYSIDYELLQGDNDSVSIANDYFEKPALLKVEDGELLMQLTVNHSKWVKELQAQDGNEFVHTKVVKEDVEDDTRVVEFKVENDLTVPFPLKMHVAIEDMEPAYDHSYTVRTAIKLETANGVGAGWVDSPSVEGSSNTILYIGIALVVFAAILAVVRVKRSKK
ncbi:NEAT domain-containing protein [Sporosarcina sp. Te-1]|uniref:NEAT domain-containing protein n=1 Tax=Sporosarcina sp. Te-1 TaxID=2818390 RepID=UPI001A9F3CCF|nr:NEAT domain-containing protein [Sporosarcina sp. Te-1]QTD40873.1 NEAT domain-containing protein [Sporosarcina sp. Te-1]